MQSIRSVIDEVVPASIKGPLYNENIENVVAYLEEREAAIVHMVSTQLSPEALREIETAYEQVMNPPAQAETPASNGEAKGELAAAVRAAVDALQVVAAKIDQL